MVRVIRPLLVQGNQKLSAGIFHFDLPAVSTCPGRSSLCERRCYARHGRFRYPVVQERLRWNLAQTKRADFVDRLVREVYRKGVLVCRFHVSGDIYSPGYARKLLEVIGRSPHCSFWFYTRSWRVPAIFPLVTAISLMPNCQVWLSADARTGFPPAVPATCRVAWLQTGRADGNAEADLVFLDHPLRRLELPVANVCPTDTPAGNGVTCATCQVCWR